MESSFDQLNRGEKTTTTLESSQSGNNCKVNAIKTGDILLMAHIEVRTKNGTRKLRLDGRVTTIGRHQSSNLVINDERSKPRLEIAFPIINALGKQLPSS